MSLPLAARSPRTRLLTALLVAFGLLLASLSVLPPAGAAEAGTTATAEPVVEEDAGSVTVEEVPDSTDASTTDDASATTDPLAEAADAVPPAEEFLVDYVGPECWDSSYNVFVEYGGDAADLRVALQEEVDGAWVTLTTERFYDGATVVFSDMLAEGETATFRVVVYDRTAPAEQTVLHGPTTVTGVSTEGCDDGWEIPSLPEDQWTAAESGCGSVTFTSRADEDVVVVWMGEDDAEFEENYFFLAPGKSATITTTDDLVYWVSLAGLTEDLDPVADEVYLAGEGEIEVEQGCSPAEPDKPAQPAPPVQPAPPADGGHTVPGKVQTDGGADTTTMVVGLLLMALAGAALARRTVARAL